MDPFNKLHEDLHPFIFQCMSGRDLLTMTEVSTLWKEIVEKEGKLEKKVRLRLDTAKPKEENLVALHESRRKYEVIDACGHALVCIELLRKFRMSVTDLSSTKIFYDWRCGMIAPVDFPNLKRLSLTEDADWLTRSTFQLEELIAKSVSNEFLNKLLKGQKKLKFLNIISNDIITLNFVPEFKLEVFGLNCSFVDFTELLYSQRQSLKEVKLKYLHFAEHFIQLMNDFPQLTKLCIENILLPLTAQQADNIAINTKITHLVVLYGWRQDILGDILLKFPNLEYLKVNNLNSDLMELIVMNMPQLKKLIHVKCLMRNPFNTLEIYEQLKQQNAGINQNIEVEDAGFFN